MFGRKKAFFWENVLDDHSVTLTQGHCCSIDKHKFACLQDKVRTTYPITTKLSTSCHAYYLIGFLRNSSGHFFCQIFFKIADVIFSMSNTLYDISQEWMVRMMWNDMTRHLDLWFSRSNFKLVVPQELLSDVKHEESKSVRYWTDCMVSPFDHTHDLDLEVIQGQSLK